MAITLSKKKVAAYNKTKTTPKTPKKLTPFIDRMTVGLNYEPNDSSASIHSNIWNQVKDTAVFTQAKPGGSYKRAWRIKLNAAVQIKHFPILRYRYTEGYAARLSLTFSPHDLGPKGLEELHATLTSIVPQGWGSFVEDGQVSMLEVSVDLPDIPIGSCHPLMQQTTVVKSWSSGGKLETLLFGKKDGNQTRIYDRAQKRKSKKQAWLQGDTTRVERVLRNQQLPLNQLAELPNPFSGMKFIDLPSKPPLSEPKQKHYVWHLFCDTVSVRGLSVALKLLPAETYRKRYRAWLTQHPQAWWQPDAIWAEWKPMIEDYKLISTNWI